MTRLSDVYNWLDPTSFWGGSFDTDTILADLAQWVEPAEYDFVLLYSLQGLSGVVRSGDRGITTPAKNIGLSNLSYGADPNFPEWPSLYQAPHMNSIDGPPIRTLSAKNAIAHTWGVYWGPRLPYSRSWQPGDPIAWLVSPGDGWWKMSDPTWIGEWLDEGLPGSFDVPLGGDRFNAFDLYAMGLMGFAEASTYSYNIADQSGNRYVLRLDDLIYGLSVVGEPYFEGNGRRVPDTDPAVEEINTLLVVVKGADETLTDEQQRLVVELAENLPAAWSVATWGRSSMSLEIVPTRFQDIVGSAFRSDIVWLADRAITEGCSLPPEAMFCPDDFVTRGQMAAFLVKALGYVDEAGGDLFVDDNDSVFESDIDKLAAAGVTAGCSPSPEAMFCPNDFVTRGQMAAFLVKALGYVDEAGGDLFVDDNDSVFESDIDKLAAAGVTAGCSPSPDAMFCPDDFVTRGQMAVFLHRALGG